MKKIISLILILTLMLSLNVFSKDSIIKIEIDGKELVTDVPPMLVNGRTMFPLRATLNALLVPDEDIIWWEASQSVEVNHKGIFIFMPIESDVAIVNDEKFKLDSPAFIVSERTMVPVRFLSEALGYDVDWDEINNKVIIKSIGE